MEKEMKFEYEVPVLEQATADVFALAGAVVSVIDIDEP